MSVTKSKIECTVIDIIQCIDLYVFEDARLDGTTNKKVREIIKPETNMADENPRVSGTK